MLEIGAFLWASPESNREPGAYKTPALTIALLAQDGIPAKFLFDQ